MKDELLKEVLKVNDSLIIPGPVVKNYDKFDLEGLEFILLLYFINQKTVIPFDFNKIGNDLNIESSKVLELINSLNEKNYISIDIKETNGVIEEFISTKLFYNKLTSILLDNDKTEKDTDIFSKFEKEFGRTLNPTEIEKINSWLDNDISEELIIEALKEASLSNVHQIRYIDGILFNWVKNGYKSVVDIKRKKYNNDEDVEVFDYDWLNE